MITKEQVQYIAGLSRMHLTAEEIPVFQKTLSDILTYIEKLNRLPVDNVPPTSHVLPIKDVFREDTIKPSLSQKEALSIAVAQAQGAFKVPQVIE